MLPTRATAERPSTSLSNGRRERYSLRSPKWRPRRRIGFPRARGSLSKQDGHWCMLDWLWKEKPGLHCNKRAGAGPFEQQKES